MEFFGRSRILSAGSFNGKVVAYWMVRDKRVQDNWALLKAQEIALKNRVPLLICFQYNGEYEIVNIRNYRFLFKGLIEMEKQLQNLNIPFFLFNGLAEISIASFIEKNFVGHLVVDYSPLKIHKLRLKKILTKTNIPITQVDAHNIVPVWESSNKKEYAAYTIRPKIKSKLSNYLTDIPRCIRHPYDAKINNKINWEEADKNLYLDKNVKEVSWIRPGESQALKRLDTLKIASISIGEDGSEFQSTLSKYAKVNHYTIPEDASREERGGILSKLSEYNLVIVGIHKSNENAWKSYKIGTSGDSS